MAVRIVTDSASGLPASEAERLGIRVVSLHVRDDDRMRPETDIDQAELARILTASASVPGTSQPSPEEFAAPFREIAEAGDDVLAIVISAKASGTMHSALLAADMVRAAVPDSRISLLDSQSNSMQEGFAVLSAAEAAAAGATLDECCAAAHETMRRTRFLFTPQTLEYLRRGGRISTASALLGSVLQIAPVLTAEDGTTAVAARVRTHRRALEAMAARMREDTVRCGLARAIVQYVIAKDEAAAFARDHIEPIVGAPVPLLPIGPIVGLHVGPAVGVVYETIEPLRDAIPGCVLPRV